MDAETQARALATLDGMAKLEEAELVVDGMACYFDGNSTPGEPILGVCGTRMCLLGSAWIAYGDAYVTTRFGDIAGTQDDEREVYLAERPALAAVFDALNAEAKAMHDEDPDLTMADTYYVGPAVPSYAEALFEGGDLDRDDLLGLIAAARKRIERAPIEVPT